MQNNNFLPPGAKWSDFITHGNVLMVKGKPVEPFEDVPIRMLRTIQDRNIKYKKGSIQVVQHMPGSTEWDIIVQGHIKLVCDAKEHVDFEFV